jgi:GT2 family glycosyltransferase
VILHYLEGAIKDTYECVNSIIENIEYDDYKIIIVENGSNDRSEILLHEKFSNNRDISILALKKNMGFAQGNNYGAKYGIKKYNPKFLVIINNDTIIKQPEFLKLIEDEYNQNKFHILGPYIYDRHNKPQNPMQIQPINSMEDIDNKVKNIELLKNKNQSEGKKSKLKTNIKKVLKKYKYTMKMLTKINEIRNPKTYYYNPDSKLDNVPLHGSALVFSEEYFHNKDYIFYPETFLYVEEEILYYLCQRSNFVMRYAPEIKIYHKEDASSDSLFANFEDKNDFIYEQHLKSYEVFKKLLREGDE